MSELYESKVRKLSDELRDLDHQKLFTKFEMDCNINYQVNKVKQELEAQFERRQSIQAEHHRDVLRNKRPYSGLDFFMVGLMGAAVGGIITLILTHNL